MSDSVNHHRTFEVLTAEPVQSRRKPRHWTDEDRHGLSRSRDQCVGDCAVSGTGPVAALCVAYKALSSGMVAPLTERASAPVKFTRFEAVGSSMVEIVVGDVVVRAGADVYPDHLTKILRVVRKA